MANDRDEKIPVDWLDALADEHQISERHYESLDKRVRSLERKGILLPDASDERWMIYLFGAYVVFGIVLPALIEAFRERQK